MTACAPDFTGASIQSLPQDFFKAPPSEKKKLSLSLFIDSNSITPSDSLLALYEKAFLNAPAECNEARITIRGEVQTFRQSAWYLGVALFIPFWPFMPQKTNLFYSLEALLYCHSTPSKKIIFTEEEETESFIYGAIRISPIEKANSLIHLKFSARLAEEFFDSRPVDKTIREESF